MQTLNRLVSRLRRSRYWQLVLVLVLFSSVYQVRPMVAFDSQRLTAEARGNDKQSQGSSEASNQDTGFVNTRFSWPGA